VLHTWNSHFSPNVYLKLNAPSVEIICFL
jgi:hypothetical protein